MRTPLEQAFFRAGGQAEVARRLGVPRGRLTDYKRRGFPVKECVRIEEVSSGLVHRKLTRPNDWRIHWPELAKPRAKKAAKGGV